MRELSTDISEGQTLGYQRAGMWVGVVLAAALIVLTAVLAGMGWASRL